MIKTYIFMVCRLNGIQGNIENKTVMWAAIIAP